MGDLSYTAYIDRGGIQFDIQVDYYIPGYSDPEDGEYFGDTGWYVTYTEAGSSGGGTFGYGGESNSAYIDLGLASDTALHTYSFDFFAQNTFSGDSVSQHLDFFAAPYATTGQTIFGTSGPNIEIGGSGPDRLRGGGQNDVLDGGDGDDTLLGGAGDDQLTGGAGHNTLIGGADNDEYFVNSVYDKIIEQAGGGYDTVFSTVTFSLASEVERLLLTGGGRLNANGNDQDNRIDGNGYANVISGLGGNDQLYGLGGNDSLYGGDGNDLLDGGTGADSMVGGIGDDAYYVDAHRDVVVEQPDEGLDTVYVSNIVDYTLGDNVENLTRFLSGRFHGIGNELDNIITGGRDNDTLEGRAGADTLIGGLGNDILIGGRGADYLVGGDGSDTASYVGSRAAVRINLSTGLIVGGDASGDMFSGIENVTGTDFDDKLTGDAGANILTGGAGDDILRGGGGDDTLIGGAGADQIFGNDGRDTLSYLGSLSGVTIDLVTHLAAGGDATGDTFSRIENVTGSDCADTLIGDNQANVLFGGAGDDSVQGGGGADIIQGGAGADTLIGGSDTNTLSYANSPLGVTVNLATGAASGGDATGDTFTGFENVTGSSDDDVLTGDTESNTLVGGAGNDIIDGGDGDDIIRGGPGADTLIGGIGTDTLSYAGSENGGIYANLAANYVYYGDASGDSISGFENLRGSELGDVLYGDANSNMIRGDAGNDVIDGGAGDDILTGDSGFDTFIFGTGYGHDTITDFESDGNGEYIEFLLGSTYDDYSKVMSVASSAGPNGRDAIFHFSNNDSLLVKNVAIGAFDTNAFVFG